MCGEKRHLSSISPFEIGSPPRVRGKGPSISRPAPASGITPACAGKRWYPTVRRKNHEDHPRVCGEKPHHSRCAGDGLGSPPRVRGKELPCNPPDRTAGITPACAGKSLLLLQRFLFVQDHPRVCGEKKPYEDEKPPALGSPPRVRGKANGTKFEVFRVGITPACAGKRLMSSNSPTAQRDHPRVCGEKFLHILGWVKR